MKKIDWKQEFPEVPDEVHRSVLHTLSTLDSQEVKKVKKSGMKGKKRLLLLAAAMTALLGTTAAAAGIFKWNERAGEVFGANEEIQEKLTMEQVAEESLQSVTDAGLTITAIQTVQDKNRFYALFEVTAEDENMMIGEDYSLDYTMDMGGKEDMFGFFGWSFLSEGEQPLSNSRYFEMYGTKSRPSDEDITMTLHFTALKGEPTVKAGEGEKLITGDWEFALNVHSSESRTCELGGEYQIGGYPVHVKSVEISPLTLIIRYDSSDVRAMEAGEGVNLAELDDLPALYPTGVFYTDGSEMNADCFPIQESMREDEGIYEVRFEFSQLADADRIAGLIIGESRVEF